MNTVTQDIKDFFKRVLSWQWTKTTVFWIILSAGTMSECAFVIASLWMILNKNVHSFFLMFLSEQMTIHLTELATMAYIGLPELILPLAIVTVLGHIRVGIFQRDWRSCVWAALYGIPTVLFLVISLVTLSYAVQSATFVLPNWMIVARADAGYVFGLTALLYHYIGQKQEAERLKEKDDFITQLIENARLLTEKVDTQKADMQKRIEGLTQETETLKHLTEQQKKAISVAKNEAIQHNGTALQAYPQECITWLNSGNKSSDMDEISRYTGHNTQKIRWAIRNGEIKKSAGRGEKYTKASIAEWLRKTPPPVINNDQHIPDTEPINLSDYTEMSV